LYPEENPLMLHLSPQVFPNLLFELDTGEKLFIPFLFTFKIKIENTGVIAPVLLFLQVFGKWNKN